jgi:hypothetical protein
MDPKLAAALISAQKEVKSALKTKEQKGHGYRYAPAEEVLIVGREALNNNDLGMRPITEDFSVISPIDDKCGGAVGIVRCRFEVFHSSGASFEFSTDVPVVPTRGNIGWARPADKSTFAARTEALGYALRDLLLIPREDAPDVSGRHDKGKAGPGTKEEQQRRQDAQQNPKKSAEQYAAEMQALDGVNPGDFGQVLKLFAHARRDVVTPQAMAPIEVIVAQKFVAKLDACQSIERLEKDATVAGRLALLGKPGEDVAKAIEAARVRLGSGQ